MEDLFTVNDGNDSLDRRFVVDYTVYFVSVGMEDLFTVNDGNDSLDRRFVVDYTVYFILIFRRVWRTCSQSMMETTPWTGDL